MNLREIGWKGVDRIHLAKDRDHGELCGNDPLGSVKGEQFLD
jgi:hypothetical protein